MRTGRLVPLASRGLQTLAAATAFAGSGALVVTSPVLAFLPTVGLGFLGLAAASTDVLILVLIALRNFTDPAADSSSLAGLGGLNPSGVIGLSVLGLAVFRLGSSRRHRFTNEVNVLLIGFTAWFLIGAFSYGLQTSLFRELVRVFSIVAIGVMATSWTRTDAFSRTADMILLATFIPAVVAVGQALSHLAQFNSGTWRSAGTFAHANTAATLFAICTVLSFWRMKNRPASYRALTGLFGIALLVTGSVGGYVQVAVSFLALAPLLSRRGHGRALPAVALATVLLVGIAVSPIGRARLAEVASGKKKTVMVGNTQVTHGSSLKWRYQNWEDEISAWKHKPIVGYGLGTTVTIVTPDGGAPHNDPLRFLVETGILGSLLFGSLTLRLFRAVSRMRRTTWPGPQAAGVLFAILLGCLAHAFAENLWAATAAMYALAALTGAAFATSKPPDDRSHVPAAVQ